MRHDIYSYGMIAPSTLHMLESKFPKSEGYAEIRQTHLMTGGEAANSSIVLARLGLKVRLDGNWLDCKPDAREALCILEKYGIDISRLVLKKDYEGVHEIVFTDGETRTIFGTYCRLLFNRRQWNSPYVEDVENARIVSIDPFFGQESVDASEICSRLQKPYVTVDCKPESRIVQCSAAVIVSKEFRDREYPGATCEGLLEEYNRASSGLVVFTSGSDEIIYGRRDGAAQRIRPYRITPVDTTGGGDAFRAGVVYGLLNGWPDEKIMRFSSALSALVCLSFPGVLGSPGPEEVHEFMQAPHD